MTLDFVFVALLLGHILGDFYFQTEKMAFGKEISFNWLIYHCVEYGVVMAAILFACLPKSHALGNLLAISALAHCAIDLFKSALSNRRKESKLLKWINARSIAVYRFLLWVKKRLYTFDQLLHIISLVVIWLIFGQGIVPYDYLNLQFWNLDSPFILVVLGILCVVRPVGFLIASGDIWDFGRGQNEKPSERSIRAGQMIGYLERTIIYLFLLYEQYGAIAFVLTAKSIARFKEIEQNRMQAEYYLIGTLLSVASAFIIAMLLGLCKITIPQLAQ